MPHRERTSTEDMQRGLLKAEGLSDRAADSLLSIDAVAQIMRRSIAKRELGRSAVAALGIDLDMASLDVIWAIEGRALEFGAPPDEPPTVGMIAERLEIDPSRASRLVADLVERGFAYRVASQADARRTCVALTDAGRAVTAGVRRYKWQKMAKSFAGWSEDDLARFAELFSRFVEWQLQVGGSTPATPQPEQRRAGV